MQMPVMRCTGCGETVLVSELHAERQILDHTLTCRGYKWTPEQVKGIRNGTRNKQRV